MASSCHPWTERLPSRDTTCLLTPRCQLRCVTEADGHALFQATLTPGFAQWLSWEPPSSADPLVQRFRHQRAAWHTGETFSFSAHAKTDDRVVGGVELKGDPVQPLPGRLNLGYWVHPLEQGQGLATELIPAVLSFAFALGCEEVVAGVGLDNAASHRVLQKLGFVEFERAAVCSATKSFANVRYRLAAPAGAQRAIAL